MDRTTIRRIVDGIDTALGPDAKSSQVEEIALEMLSRTDVRQNSRLLGDQSRGTISPESLVVHVRVDDCTSRLASTVVAHCYDKLRRLTTDVPASCRHFFDSAGHRIPDIELRVHGAELLVKGFPVSECIEILSSINAAGIDASFDRIKLLKLSSGKSGSASYLLSALPDLMTACPDSGFEIEIGSRRTGLRSQELLDLSRAALRPGALSSCGNRFILSCNSANTSSIFQSIRGDIKIDLSLAAWPQLSNVQSHLAVGACYTDRFNLLGQTGVELYKKGHAVLSDLCDSVGQPSGSDLIGNIELSLDASGEGPLASGSWTGLPVESLSASGADRAAALLLKEGLSSEIGPSQNVVVTADGLPVSNTIRNFRRVSTGLSEVELAGYLVDEFSDMIVAGTTKMIALLGTTEDESRNSRAASSSFSQKLRHVSGPVETIEGQNGWSEGHFSRGGALIPPAE